MPRKNSPGAKREQLRRAVYEAAMAVCRDFWWRYGGDHEVRKVLFGTMLKLYEACAAARRGRK